MTTNFSPKVRVRLGKIIRMLGSDKEGDRAAAVAALSTTLAAEGASFHELAAAIESEQTVIVRREVIVDTWTPPEPTHGGPPSWFDLRDFQRRDWLTVFATQLDIADPQEKQALTSFRASFTATADHRPTRRQLDLFTRLLERAWKVGVRP